jgi:hypothetical protein
MQIGVENRAGEDLEERAGSAGNGREVASLGGTFEPKPFQYTFSGRACILLFIFFLP